MAHTAGMPVTVPGADWLARVGTAAQVQIGGVGQFCYSNFAYDVAGYIVELVTGSYHRAVDDLMRRLAINGSIGRNTDGRRVTLTGPWSASPNGPGYVQDGSPHGGLITDAAGALKLARAYSAEGHIVPTRLRLRATAVQAHTERPQGYHICDPQLPWGFGVELKGSNRGQHYAPPDAADTSFGHYGALGTLAWWDPKARCGWAILPSGTPDCQYDAAWYFGARSRISGWLRKAAMGIAHV